MRPRMWMLTCITSEIWIVNKLMKICVLYCRKVVALCKTKRKKESGKYWWLHLPSQQPRGTTIEFRDALAAALLNLPKIALQWIRWGRPARKKGLRAPPDRSRYSNPDLNALRVLESCLLVGRAGH